MKWVLILIWSHNSSMMGAQFGPMIDRPTCERAKAELTKNMQQWSGIIRGSCVLISIDSVQLPKVEIQTPKAKNN